jgi:hypothetical protein
MFRAPKKVKLRSRLILEARSFILPFVKHPKSCIRREAKKALNKMDDLD